MKRHLRCFFVRLLVLGALLPAVSPVTAQSGVNVISPAEGVWANKQALVLDVPDSVEVYYSFTGSDPLNFGFAYDGPVVLDAEGMVPLRLAVVSEDGGVEQIKISYTVREPDVSWKLPFDDTQPVMLYSPGDVVPIPETFLYCLGGNTVPDIGGRALCLDGDTFPARHVPCTVTDGVYLWRFVIETEGASARSAPVPPDVLSSDGSDSESVPPFIVSDWDYITFNRGKLIYCVDNGIWEEATGSVYIDRSEPHTIFWQSVAYEPGNPVYSVVLPPRPPAEHEYRGNSAAMIELEGGYKITLHGSKAAPVSSLVVDAFYGEELSENFLLDVYLGELYQGTVSFSVLIDKEPPSKASIVPSSSLFYNREPISFHFEHPDDVELFYDVSLVAERNAGFSELELSLSGARSAVSDGFDLYTGSPVIVDSVNGKAAMYCVQAYTRDTAGNVSAVSEHRVIIDPYNYYVSSNNLRRDSADDGAGSSSVAFPDGSLARPFSSLGEVLAIVNSGTFARIHIDGMLDVEENIVISSKCELNGTGPKSGLRVDEGVSILIGRDAQVAFTNCVFELCSSTSSLDGSGSLFVIDNASVAFAGCEIVADFGGSGSIFSADSSSVTLDDCGATVRAGRYASLFSGVRTNITVTAGRYTAVAPTAVVFSLSAGMFTLSGADCRVFANLGRIAELSGVSATVTGNTFSAELQGDSAAAARVTPLWHDGRSKFLDNSDNAVSGFPGGTY